MAGKLKQLQSSKLINPEKRPLTTEKLRELSGLNLTDEEAEEAINSIRLLAKTLYDFTNHQNSTCIDNQHVVNLEEPNFNPKKQAA